MNEDEIRLLLHALNLWSEFHGNSLTTSPCCDPFSDSVCALDDMPLREVIFA